jgi:hypothetical protein
MRSLASFRWLRPRQQIGDAMVVIKWIVSVGTRVGSGYPERDRSVELSDERRRRRTNLSLGLVGLAILAVSLAACGGSAAAAPTSGSDGTTAEVAISDPGTDGSGSDGSEGAESSQSPGSPDGDADATGGLADRIPDDMVALALGELPDVTCDTSVLLGGDSCVWMAQDGSYLKVERSVAVETPTPEAFADRMVNTLGVDEPVQGLGQAAFRYTGDQGTRVAVYLGDGLVIWVDLENSGATAEQADLIVDMVKLVVAGE